MGLGAGSRFLKPVCYQGSLFSSSMVKHKDLLDNSLWLVRSILFLADRCHTSLNWRLSNYRSAAAYTGLQVDIDRIRADNAARVGVERKSGLIIWAGGRCLPNKVRESIASHVWMH